MCPRPLSRSQPGPKISPGEGAAQFTPPLISCPCVTSASVGAKPRCGCRGDRDPTLCPHPLGMPWAGAVCRGVGGRAGGPAPSGCGREAKGCPGAARRGAPTGSTRVYSSEGELMQFPSSCLRERSCPGSRWEGGYQGLTGNRLPRQPHGGDTSFHPGHAGPSPSPRGFGKRGWRDGDSGRGFRCAGRKDRTSFLNLLLKLMIYRGLQNAISRLLISPAHNLN